MKKVFLSLLVCLTILGSNAMVVNAEGFNMAEALASTMYVNAKHVSANLSIRGTTAYCSVRISANDGTESISGTATLTNASTGRVVTSWNISTRSNICALQKEVTVPKGYTYNLSFSGIVKARNGSSEHISCSSTASN